MKEFNYKCLVCHVVMGRVVSFDISIIYFKDNAKGLDCTFWYLFYTQLVYNNNKSSRRVRASAKD